MDTILVVDDDLTFARIIVQYLRKEGYPADMCHSAREAEAVLEKKQYALLLLDYRLPDGTGLDLMAAAKSRGYHAPAIIMTSFNDVRTAVNAIRSGAFDYITKPVNREELLMLVQQVMQQETAATASALPAFVEGESAASKKLHQQIRLIAPTDMSVIIQGESGTGKEYVARLIHGLSERAGKTFIAVDCGTLSTELAASELFGHRKGAFTGALHDKKGKFEEANGGTIFLDEIGNLNYEVQVKLLRAIQERVMTPIGSNKEIRFDVRIIVATNEDLKTCVGQGRFRDDLYHRLNEYKIQVPPLREREEDLFLFTEHFIWESNQALKRTVQALSPGVTRIFRGYDWPGNIRELRNIVKRLVLLSEGSVAGEEGLPEEMLLGIAAGRPEAAGTDLKQWQELKERELIEKALKEVNYNKQKAARLLNINRSTLYAKIDKYGIVEKG